MPLTAVELPPAGVSDPNRAKSTLNMRDTVRLLNQHGDIPAGAIGSVLGWFVDLGSYVVNFPDEGPRLAEVRADEIDLVASV
jgi:hypothetical protein